MSIKGFNVNGITEQYDYNSLDNIPDIQGIPTGGTEGQVLAKTSGADYAVGWVNQTGGGDSSSADGVFWCYYGTTSTAEIEQAINDDKLPVCQYDGRTYVLSRVLNEIYYFESLVDTSPYPALYILRVNGSKWTGNFINLQTALAFDTHPIDGSANPVTSNGVYNAIRNATVSDEKIAEAVDDWLTAQAPTIGTLSYAAKQALLACFRNVAWVNEDGQQYYDALEAELFPPVGLDSISAVFTQGSAVIYDTDSLDTLKQYLTVTANYSDSTTATVTDYTLSGTLAVGTSTITVSYGGKTDTFDVTVSSETEWEDGVAYETSVYQPLQQNVYWSNGRLASYNGWHATQNVNCYNASQLYFARASGSSTLPDGRYNVFLASDGTTVLGTFYNNKDSSSTAALQIINVPTGAKYFSISEASAQINRLLSGEYTITPHA